MSDQKKLDEAVLALLSLGMVERYATPWATRERGIRSTGTQWSVFT